MTATLWSKPGGRWQHRGDGRLVWSLYCSNHVTVFKKTLSMSSEGSLCDVLLLWQEENALQKGINSPLMVLKLSPSANTLLKWLLCCEQQRLFIQRSGYSNTINMDFHTCAHNILTEKNIISPGHIYICCLVGWFWFYKIVFVWFQWNAAWSSRSFTYNKRVCF